MLAQEEARQLSHSYIGTEHVLLGLIHEGEGVAAKDLETLGNSLEPVRGPVDEISSCPCGRRSSWGTTTSVRSTSSSA